MEAQDLRIGNYVYPNVSYPEPIQIKANNIVEMFQCEISDSEMPFEPIPLTEEWLLKFGYVKFIENSAYSSLSLVDDNVLIYTVLLVPERNEFIFPNTYKPVEIKYVHQLQNLYFALTDRELTIKQ